MKVIGFFGVFFLFATACQPGANSGSTSLPSNQKATVNPNGESELALLMRSMTDFMEQAKGNLQNGMEIQDCPEEFNRLTTAKETEGIIQERDHFNAYSEQWLDDLEKLCNSNGQEQIQAYEQLRTSCLTCHQSYCQGPIPKIERLTYQKP